MKFIKENRRVVIAILIAIVLIISGIILIGVNKDEKAPIKQPETEESIEEDLNNATGFSKEDAVKVVKENFTSDNYEFTATATKDGLYKVVVKNIVTDSKIIYYVDPTDGNAYIDLGTN